MKTFRIERLFVLSKISNLLLGFESGMAAIDLFSNLICYSYFMDSNPHTLQQASIFQGFWDQFSEQINDGKGISDFPSAEDKISKHVTTVARIPDAVAQKITTVGSEIISKYPNHYFYPTTDLHFTFINLDAFFPIGFQKEHEVIFKPLINALHNLPPLELEARGLSLFPTTIFVQLYDTNGLIEQYRTIINDTVRRVLDLPSTENKGVAEDVVFANLIRFRDVPTPDVINDIVPFREIDFGSFTVPKIELVTTDKLLSKQNTVIHYTYSLNL